MLAKTYHFPYEAIKSLASVKAETRKQTNDWVCMKDVFYPIWNIEYLVEYMRKMKDEMKEQLDKCSQNNTLAQEHIVALIHQMMLERFKNLRLCLIPEDGYKAYFYLDNEKGPYQFDLSVMRRANYIGHCMYPLNIMHYQGEDIDLAQICPECWCGNWSIIKNSL